MIDQIQTYRMQQTPTAINAKAPISVFVFVEIQLLHFGHCTFIELGPYKGFIRICVGSTLSCLVSNCVDEPDGDTEIGLLIIDVKMGLRYI